MTAPLEVGRAENEEVVPASAEAGVHDNADALEPALVGEEREFVQPGALAGLQRREL